MNFFTENNKRVSGDFSDHFGFLTTEYGLKMIEEGSPVGDNSMYVRKLRNLFVQVELAGDQTYFHVEIRRLINGEPQPFSDLENNIGFEVLAVLVTSNNYDHLEFYPPSAGWIKVLGNTADLFQKSKEVFTTGKWIDTARLEELRNEAFFKKFGFSSGRDKNKPAFFELVRQHVSKFTGRGYKLVLDSRELPPYDRDRMLQKIILEGFGKQVKISQRDLRDDYTGYYIAINGKEMFQIDTRDYGIVESAAEIFNKNLDGLLL